MKQPSHLTTSFWAPIRFGVLALLGGFSTIAAAAETPSGNLSPEAAAAVVEDTLSPAPADLAVLADPTAPAQAVSGRDWIAERSDNICGLSQASQLTRPARIDYDDVLAATPQMKRVRDERIDPSSATGIRLRAEAVRLVSQKCEEVRSSGGYCSVWKAIRHRDGRTIANISDEVIALF